jgi:hypothetical protein
MADTSAVWSVALSAVYWDATTVGRLVSATVVMRAVLSAELTAD